MRTHLTGRLAWGVQSCRFFRIPRARCTQVLGQFMRIFACSSAPKNRESSPHISLRLTAFVFAFPHKAIADRSTAWRENPGTMSEPDLLVVVNLCSHTPCHLASAVDTWHVGGNGRKEVVHIGAVSLPGLSGSNRFGLVAVRLLDVDLHANHKASDDTTEAASLLLATLPAPDCSSDDGQEGKAATGSSSDHANLQR